MSKTGFKGGEAGVVVADFVIADCYGHGLSFFTHGIHGKARKAVARRPTALPSRASLAMVPPQPRVSSSGCAAMRRMDFILGPFNSWKMKSNQNRFLPTPVK
jgi:hypothetical protein